MKGKHYSIDKCCEKMKNRCIQILKSKIFIFTAFLLLVMGDAQFLINKGINKPFLYIGFLILLSSIYGIEILQNNYRKRYKIYILAFLVISLMIVGIIIETLGISKKMVLIFSVLILVSLALFSDNIFDNMHKIKFCAYGIFAGVVCVFICSLFFDNIQFFQSNISKIGLTCGLSHKNFLATTLLSSFIGIYIGTKNDKIKKYEIIIILIEIVLIILSTSRGTYILMICFLLLANSEFLFKLQKKYRYGIYIVISLVASILFAFCCIKIQNYNLRINGLLNYFKTFQRQPFYLFFGMSDIAYLPGEFTENVRSIIGWNGTTEMSIVAILVKGGLIAVIGYIIVFYRYIKKALKINSNKLKISTFAVLIIFLVSGLVETYIMNMNLVFGIACYCYLSGMSCTGFNLNLKSQDKI